MRNLVIVETNLTTGRQFALRARALGLNPVIVTRMPGYFPYVEELGLQEVEADTTSAEQVHRRLREQVEGSIDAVLSVADRGVLQAAELARSLGLPTLDPDTVRTCRDKHRLRAVLRAAGIDDVYSALVAHPGDLDAVCAQARWPLVLKPLSASGSIGARLCADAAQLRAHHAALQAMPLNMVQDRRCVAEEFVEGTQYSVEFLGGAVVGVTEQEYSPPPHFVATGHSFPAFDGQGPLHQAALRFAQEVARCIGLDFGGAHMEIRFDARAQRFRMIECNPRLAGAHVPELVRQATGIDLIDKVVRAHLGEREAAPPGPVVPSSMQFLLAHAPGRLAGVAGVERAREAPGVADVTVYSRPGASIALHGDHRDRLGHVIARGGSIAAARGNALAAVALLEVELADAP